jgi:hypothetical protein
MMTKNTRQGGRNIICWSGTGSKLKMIKEQGAMAIEAVTAK